MNKSRDLNACVASLRAMQSRDDVEPEQKKSIERVINGLKAFRRKAHPKQQDVFELAREIADEIVIAFFNR